MKIELVMTIWEDGLFKLRDRIEADSFDSLEAQLRIAIGIAKDNLTKPKYPFMDDDDIPF
jgi:hypothetical protein